MKGAINLLINIGCMGFFTAWTGMLAGMLLCYLTGGSGKRFKGTVLGFLGGVMLSIVCFDIIPESFESSNQYTATFGIILGLVTAILLDGSISQHSGNIRTNKKKHYTKVATFIAVGIGIHNIPNGFALGSLLASSHSEGSQFAMVLLLDSVPDGLTVGMYLTQGAASLITIIMFTLLPALPLGGGAFIGGIISKISPLITSTSLSFAAGLILYTVCKEMLPESISLWKGRLSAIGTVLGIIIGKLFVSMIH